MTATRRSDPGRAAPRVDGYEVFGVRFGFAARSDAARRGIRRLYHGFELQRPSASAPTFALETRGTASSRDWWVTRKGARLARASSLGKALESTERKICGLVMASARGVVWIHGATVVGPRGTALLCGDSGAGKTTLGLALAARGFTLLGDDVSVLDPRTGELHAHPRCFHLDGPSRRLLRRLGLRTRGTPPGFVTPADVGGFSGRARNVRTIVLLEAGRVAGRLSLTPVSQAEALARMIDLAGGISHPTPKLLRAVRPVVGGASCFRLSRGRIDEAAGLVAGLLESP